MADDLDAYRTVVSTTSIGRDKEIHVSVLDVTELLPGETPLVEVREFIPSVPKYGRGTTPFGPESIPAIVEGLRDAFKIATFQDDE